MSCSRYRQLISRYVDNEVTPRQRADLLAHVQHCPECAAWLARARQTDVLLKGVSDTRPSDRVRNAILSEVRSHSSHAHNSHAHNSHAHNSHDGKRPARPAPQHDRIGSLRLGTAGLLLRFDLSPARVAFVAAASLLALVGMAYYLNLLPPFWSYSKLGFEYRQDNAQAIVGTTPIPYNAVTSGLGGVGGPVAVPNLVRALPTDSSQNVPLDTPLRVRFDQPMDRGSVENALAIDPPAAGTFAWDADNELRFTPASPGLLRGITYTVSLSSTALSLAGTPIKGRVSWAFRTEETHSVTAGLPGGTTVAPTSTFTLQFDVPMQPVDASSIVSLHQAGSQQTLPFASTWSPDGKSLLVAPKSAMPDGYYYLLVQANAATQAGESLGQPYELDYNVSTPGPRLRLLDGPVLLAARGNPVSVRYEMANASPYSSYGLAFDVYALPAEEMSAVGTQAGRGGSLPDGVWQASAPVKHIDPAGPGYAGSAEVGALPAGIYLLVARASARDVSATDWKLLVVSDSHLTLTGSSSPLWATNRAGRPWQDAEISLYSPSGRLLEKGPADASGLWLPTAASDGASLAVARDQAGHLAAALVASGTSWGGQAHNSLAATLVTDLPEYHPGGTANFHLVLSGPAADPPAIPLAEQDISLSLLTPGGSTVEVLTLKPDGVGGVSGAFPLSSDVQPGVYTIRAVAGSAVRDFPLTVQAAPADTLSVYILPDAGTGDGGTIITRTVSVLGPGGAPAAGVPVTATLAIRGDSWVSGPVTGMTDSTGRATFTAPLPDWFARFNDPGLYLRVEARSGDSAGSDTSYLDAGSQRILASGMTQLVSPGLNVAVVARPVPDGYFKVRAVLVDQSAPYGDMLLQAVSPDGDTATYSLDMARLLDATVPVPQRFAGGTITVRVAGKDGARTIPLMPLQDPEANLRVIVPFTVTAGAPLPVRLGLTDMDGAGIGGTASIWLRRVSGEPSTRPLDWQPTVTLAANGTRSTTLTAPNTPGLWYVMVGAAIQEGSHAVSWGVVRVTPGPWVQVPPVSQVTAGDRQTFSVVVYNPTSDPLSTGVSAGTTGGVHILGDDSQSLSLDPGSWSQLSWDAVSTVGGLGRIAFSFAPGSGIDGSWALDVPAKPNPSIDTTSTAGALNGERSVGVAVPSGLSNDSVRLEIRASTSLLPTLVEIAADIQDSPATASDGVATSAAQLSAPSSVSSTYARLNASVPASIRLSGVQYSLLLQQLYAAQHDDGGWGYTLDGTGTSSTRMTAEVLLALNRFQAYNAGDGSQPVPDHTRVDRAVSYLYDEIARPVSVSRQGDALDARAYGLCVLTLYRDVPIELVRSMMAYADPELKGHGLSQDGQAWLALALWHGGNSADAVALLDHLLADAQGAPLQASAPVLEALVVGRQSQPAGASGITNYELSATDYEATARLYARALMETRQGAGWLTPDMTADALWALSRYAAAEGENPQPNATPPILVLGDRPVQADTLPGNPGAVSVVLSGAELRPGTNWLKIRAADPNQTLYYSLTLIATR